MADFLTQPASSSGQSLEWYGGNSATSFNVPNLSGTYSGGYPPPEVDGKMQGGLGLAGPGGLTQGAFEDEPPLLEELGIDIGAILKKVRGVLLLRLRHDDVISLDIGGPLIFLLIISSLHLLTGKLHFGVMLGWSTVGSAAMFGLTNMLSGIDSATKIDLYNTCCLLGYGMIPLCIFSAADVVLPRGVLTAALATVVLLWSTYVATRMFLMYTPSLLEKRSLVAYPCMLFYCAFLLLSFY